LTGNNKALLNTALILSFVTIGYNLVEGGVSVFFGTADGALSLLGFGVDSFVEVLSGIGVAHMIIRMKFSDVTHRDKVEKLALKITGTGFYILTAGLILGSILNVVKDAKPDTTLPGIIISSVSIVAMYFLMNSKLKVGKQLNSDAIIADAECSKVCFNLSLILLSSSLLYMFLRIGYIDILGSLGIAYYSFREGKESFEKSSGNSLACSCEKD
jgi:divalent metal cation (Fe/Co/Zn/Cd) transporter